jgi:hypothetical protein
MISTNPATAPPKRDPRRARAGLRLTPDFERMTTMGDLLRAMIPLLDGPVSAVSEPFMRGIIGPEPDAVWEYFGSDLISVLRKHGMLCTTNPVFGKLIPPFTPPAVAAARGGNPGPILREKSAKRAEMLRAIADFEDTRVIGHLDGGAGRPLRELPEDVPVFHAYGRLEPLGQKGFDILGRTIENFPRGRARFILTPDVSPGTNAFLEDLARLAAWFPGEMIIFPFRMERGYKEIMGGATFAVAWSLFETFGAATEPYLSGTPVLARGTGGYIVQVSGVEDASGYPTGLITREALPHGLPAGENWKRILDLADPDTRMTIPLYRALVVTLREALIRATDIFRNERDSLYATMLANVFDKAVSFSPTRTADEYWALYAAAISRS